MWESNHIEVTVASVVSLEDKIVIEAVELRRSEKEQITKSIQLCTNHCMQESSEVGVQKHPKVLAISVPGAYISMPELKTS